MSATRIPTALELTSGELILLRNVVANGFMPRRQAQQADVARLVLLQLVQNIMGGLIATPAGRIVARL
jgi:hypothetical protein